ncbi:AMP-binding protein [Aciduricibacillus chroicocephali]|uniref:AMP-binding protein n=1 Tax=Aciduricibacillus chroicocephali TaxID=3054939 RepID=A0ABY9KUG2_9BACI|nr:AMP-binding protein [Bacillaceae bacterium 44XB]
MVGITDSYRTHADTLPDKLAIRCGEEAVNYGDWHERIERTANWLHSLEASRKVIAFLIPNGIPFLQLFAGAAHAGWTALPLDSKWTKQEIAVRLEVARPSIVIGPDEMFAERLNPITLPECLEKISHMPTGCMAHLYSQSGPFYMGFTSGTTGLPKAFVRSQRSWVDSFQCSEKDFGVLGTETILVPGSLISSHFLYGAIHALHAGATVILLEKFNALSVRELLESGSIHTVYVVPTMVEALIREGISDLPCAVKAISSGAKWQESVKAKLVQLGFQPFELYGASELSFVTVMAEGETSGHPACVGKACIGVGIEIRDNDGTEVQAGETGKIFVRSGLLFDGYLGENHNLEDIRDERGFITVDDMGWLDDRGYLHVAGREKNMILYGGLNIFPEEIERVLGSCPHVDEVAVIGRKDAYWGEIAVAVVRGKTTKLELQRWCKSQGLAAYKVPRQFYFIEEMPYTTSGKVARAELRDRFGKERSE